MFHYTIYLLILQRITAKLCTSRPNQAAVFLWVQDPISENFIIPDGILVLAAGVAGVALNGVDDAVFAFFHDADVIGFAVLRAGCAVRVVPVEENDHAGSGINRVIRPLLAAAEPLSNRFTCWF